MTNDTTPIKSIKVSDEAHAIATRIATEKRWNLNVVVDEAIKLLDEHMKKTGRVK